MLPSAQRPENYLVDSNNPLILTMWKLHGPEPMKHVQIMSFVLNDGSVKRFDLLTSRVETVLYDDQIKTAMHSETGELMVKLTRDPLNTDRRKPFNWSVTFAITNGGLEDVTNIYSNEAPLQGYQPAVTLNFPTNMVGWRPDFGRAYYFKSQGGQVYGRIAIHVSTGRGRISSFDAEIYANPGGSRNLEYDSKKDIGLRH
jgi:hypothetical protein